MNQSDHTSENDPRSQNHRTSQNDNTSEKDPTSRNDRTSEMAPTSPNDRANQSNGESESERNAADAVDRAATRHTAGIGRDAVDRPGLVERQPVAAGDVKGGELVDLRAVAEVLAAERVGTAEQIAILGKDLAEIISAARSVATDDEHDPEGVTIAFERAQVAANLDRARGRLADLDWAIARLAEGAYGRCERCGQPIAPGRLVARPAARTCITCASQR